MASYFKPIDPTGVINIILVTEASELCRTLRENRVSLYRWILCFQNA
jgi:hypothetical protein